MKDEEKFCPFRMAGGHPGATCKRDKCEFWLGGFRYVVFGKEHKGACAITARAMAATTSGSH